MRQSKSKTWENDDSFAKPEVKPLLEDKHEEEGESHLVKDDPSSQSKKARVDEPSKPSEVTSVGKPDSDIGNRQEDLHAQEVDEPDEPDNGPMSDADWLRSKTSRLLGLLDDEEQAEFDAASQRKREQDEQQGQLAYNSNQDSQNMGALTTVAQAENGTGETAQAAGIDTNIDHVRASARLFVRNLSYDTTEADLEPVFAPFGKIEEVSLYLF